MATYVLFLHVSQVPQWLDNLAQRVSYQSETLSQKPKEQRKMQEG